MGVHLTVGVNLCILLAWGNVLPKLSLFSLFLHNSKWVTATLQQAITEPKSQTFISESLVITLWKCNARITGITSIAGITADSDSLPLGIRRHSTPELESFSTRHSAKQNPSSHSRGIINESTMAQQQIRNPTKCNHSSNNVGPRQIRILRVSHSLHCSQNSTPGTQLHRNQFASNDTFCHNIDCSTDKLSDGGITMIPSTPHATPQRSHLLFASIFILQCISCDFSARGSVPFGSIPTTFLHRGQSPSGIRPLRVNPDYFSALGSVPFGLVPTTFLHWGQSPSGQSRLLFCTGVSPLRVSLDFNFCIGVSPDYFSTLGSVPFGSIPTLISAQGSVPFGSVPTTFLHWGQFPSGLSRLLFCTGGSVSSGSIPTTILHRGQSPSGQSRLLFCTGVSPLRGSVSSGSIPTTILHRGQSPSGQSRLLFCTGVSPLRVSPDYFSALGSVPFGLVPTTFLHWGQSPSGQSRLLFCTGVSPLRVSPDFNFCTGVSPLRVNPDYFSAQGSVPFGSVPATFLHWGQSPSGQS
ncbi:hypothetical protein CRG98_034687 [Punica granatum]|uniref:Uncharacterized protein n=1 Tax=Punica granatum TaxID=22663 RepID=A0A2I0ILN6_PUNGR|nr:hypothetical protein CRG98_034687 [Punica granatum]